MTRTLSREPKNPTIRNPRFPSFPQMWTIKNVVQRRRRPHI
jgi:hypothetical protein